METDPAVSAVVTLRRDAHLGVVSKAKAAFGAVGFEVHAPLNVSFSILAPRSRFESVFGVKVTVEDQLLMQSVTVEGGGLELPMEGVPEEVRPDVEQVSFVPPPELKL